MRAEFFHKRRGEFAGMELERHYLGNPIDWSSILDEHGFREQGKELNLKQWIELFKKAYPLNPQGPEQKWGKDIFDFTAEELDIDIEEPKELSFYSALGSGLDYRGIDCFFVFKNPKTKKEAFITIDISCNPKKDEWKSDVIVPEFPDWRSKEKEYIEKMQEKAKEIAEVLKQRTNLAR